LAPERAQVTELESGIRVVTEAVSSVRSVALGLWVRTGSRDETPAQAGVSHFLEHLLFKGTKRYSAIEIAEIFDGLGASVNAATGKESTNLYARFLDTHTEEAFDLLAEMLLGPTYPEIDSEREVVLEEIAMYEDELSSGEEIDVTVVEVDKERGRIGLRLTSDPDVEGKSPEELASVGSGSDRGGDRGPRRDGRRGGGDRERRPRREGGRERRS